MDPVPVSKWMICEVYPLAANRAVIKILNDFFAFQFVEWRNPGIFFHDVTLPTHLFGTLKRNIKRDLRIDP